MARILVYGLNYTPEPTGTGKYTGEMAGWLASRGHSVDAVAALPHYPMWSVFPDYRGKGFHEEIVDEVRVLRAPLLIPPPDRLGAVNRIAMELSYTFNALRYWLPILWSRRRYDAVIAVSPPFEIGLLPWLYGMIRRVPWVYHIQDLQVDAAVRLGMVKGGLLLRTLYALETFLLRKASIVSTITEPMRRRTIAKGVAAERTWLFPNWSDISFVRPLSKHNDFRRSLGVTDEQFVVMYAGNMGEKQGLELILHAAQQLQSNPRVHFVLVGSGAAHVRLEALAAEMRLPNLQFRPVQPVEAFPEVLAAADIHLVVQKREAADLVMPSKLTNILAAGRPVLATADSGTALFDVVSSNQIGAVSPPDDVAGLVTELKSLIATPHRLSDMGKNARHYAERYLDKQSILADFEGRLMALIGERKGEREHGLGRPCCHQ